MLWSLTLQCPLQFDPLNGIDLQQPVWEASSQLAEAPEHFLLISMVFMRLDGPPNLSALAIGETVLEDSFPALPLLSMS
jgi:hypothetical protein